MTSLRKVGLYCAVEPWDETEGEFLWEMVKFLLLLDFAVPLDVESIRRIEGRSTQPRSGRPLGRYSCAAWLPLGSEDDCCISPGQKYAFRGDRESPDSVSVLPIVLSKGIMG